MRPFTLFTSYRRVDSDAIEGLERQLRIRGLRSWRDVRSIGHGAASTDEIRRAIRAETDGFLAVATNEYLARNPGRADVVWDVELPEAGDRWRSGRYPVTPLFVGTQAKCWAQRCAEEGLADLGSANGSHAGGDPASAEHAFSAEAHAQLRNALTGAGSELVVAFRSFPMATLPPAALLDIDWAAEIDSRGPETWQEELLPALDDLHDALGAAGVRMLHVHVLARLSAALAFGIKIPLATGIHLTPYGRDGEVWDARASLETRPLLREDRLAHRGDPRVAVVELSIVRDLARDGAALAEQVGAATHLRLASATADRSTDPRPEAGAVAGQIGDTARRLRTEGITDFHVLLASPAPLAVLIGQQLHAIGRVHAYFRDDAGRLARAFSTSA